MQYKRSLLLVPTLLSLVSCNTGVKKKFVDTKFFDKPEFECLVLNDVQKGDELYYYFFVTKDVKFDIEHDKGVNLVCFDTKDSYDSFHFNATCHFYDADFNELPSDTLKNVYSFNEENCGDSCFIITQDIQDGKYYFSLEIEQDVDPVGLSIWIAYTIGD